MNNLFSKHSLSERLENQKINMVRETEHCEPGYIFKVSTDDYSEYLIIKYSEVVPILYENETYILNQEEVRKDGSERPTLASASMLTGEVILTIAIPFEGNKALFDCQPSNRTVNPPQGKVEAQEIHLLYQTRDLNPEVIKKENKKRINLIKKYLEWIKKDVENHNEWVKEHVKKQVLKRRQIALKTQGFLESIDLPIKRRDDLPATYTIPVVRKKITISKPVVTSEVYKPEPTLEEAEYEHVLEIISNMSLAMERNPRTFSRLNEEEIRNFFLIILNSHYEGQATGETFNVSGKTDILIRTENRNVFIAECKIWDGPKTLLGAIKQILRYSSWRDTKTAVLLFNKDREFSQLLCKINETAKSHRCHKRQHMLKSSKLKGETIFSLIFHQPHDRNREMIISIMAYNIPSS